ncbi:hypothetical protein AMECASPLE_031838 [Ameca splendens]|uniref:Uncharacterized protein n=1 Tax=Ameca splendens TaxID=208324 RepID=A0ABV1A1V2_9TELE
MGKRKERLHSPSLIKEQPGLEERSSFPPSAHFPIKNNLEHRREGEEEGSDEARSTWRRSDRRTRMSSRGPFST